MKTFVGKVLWVTEYCCTEGVMSVVFGQVTWSRIILLELKKQLFINIRYVRTKDILVPFLVSDFVIPNPDHFQKLLSFSRKK